MILQITPDVSQTTTPPVDGSPSVWELTLAGGPVMILIAMLFILAVYLIVERALVIRRAGDDPGPFMARIKTLVLKGDIPGAKNLCKQNNSPVARMIEKGVSRIGSPLKNIESAIEHVGKIEAFKLEKNLSFLATIAGAAPMLGFLGTALGLVQAFMSVAGENDTVSPAMLSAGVYTAMTTTIAGLVVGLVAYAGYNLLLTFVQKVVHSMEHTAIDFIDLLQEPR